ncbi:MAG: hypothetical protein Q8R81_13855 [Novosphingobium sp.]|uniref:trypsin-like peptidase domain-containing protein n=1 Tax=Novosphingobium sp. TaxID=1874826 RepID=UPI002732719E|nr:trypsin-like peptidase domain-containing protein [Novosphingobium sp.]MDP3551459.1 hypothetical protein [Novosphingobium sp.]
MSTINVAYGKNRGTGYLVTIDSKTVIVSACHIFSGIQVGDSIQIISNAEENFFSVVAYFECESGYDICAISVDGVCVEHLKDTQMGGVLDLGEELKFLGYPHGISSTLPGRLAFPSPLVRTAFFSGVIKQGDLDLIILDGFNNPGFSGGPLFKMTELGASLVGIISSYRWEDERHSRVYKRENGDKNIVENTFSEANSGLIQVVPIGAFINGIWPSIRRYSF